MMRRNVTCAALALLVGALACPAHAGPADTPLPTFSDSKTAVKVYTAIGAIKNNGLETAFFCTNLDSAPQDIGVEVFDQTGTRGNTIGSGNGAVLGVAPGATVTITTGATKVIHEDKIIVLEAPVIDLGNGSARVGEVTVGQCTSRCGFAKTVSSATVRQPAASAMK